MTTDRIQLPLDEYETRRALSDKLQDAIAARQALSQQYYTLKQVSAALLASSEEFSEGLGLELTDQVIRRYPCGIA